MGEMLKFGTVGVVAFVIDLGGYNLLVFGPHLMGLLGEGEDTGALHGKPLTARIISASVGTFVAWLGNRLWTFRHRRQRPAAHELALFVAFNLVAMAIAVACLSVSRYVLDLHSPLTDNVANIIGIGFGALFRFWAYREFVFAGAALLEPAVQELIPDEREGLIPADRARWSRGS
jgi:putative flippase GtrA